MCGNAHSYVRHHSVIFAAWLIHICHMPHCCVWHAQCHQQALSLRHCMTHVYVHNDPSICAVWLTHVCHIGSAINKHFQLDTRLLAVGDWRGPLAVQRGSTVYRVASGVVAASYRMAMREAASKADVLDRSPCSICCSVHSNICYGVCCSMLQDKCHGSHSNSGSRDELRFIVAMKRETWLIPTRDESRLTHVVAMSYVSRFINQSHLTPAHIRRNWKRNSEASHQLYTYTWVTNSIHIHESRTMYTCHRDWKRKSEALHELLGDWLPDVTIASPSSGRSDDPLVTNLRFTRVSWLIQICVMTRSHTSHSCNAFMCVS